MRRTRRWVVSLVPFVPAAALAARTRAPRNAYLHIISPVDGARLRGGFFVYFGLRNMGVTHAGDDAPDAGHHHLLIDVDEPIDPDQPIPSDKKHLHFGAGETETYLELPPGRHTLQLMLGDANHVPFDPPVVSRKIHITVLAPSGSRANR